MSIDIFDKIRYAINFIRENGTNTCNSNTWNAHCAEWDSVNSETYALEPKVEALTRQVSDIKAALPDDFTESKDWAFDTNPVCRIEWLKLFHKSHRDEIDRLSDQVAELQATIDALMLEHCPNEMSKAQLDNWAKHQQISKE